MGCRSSRTSLRSSAARATPFRNNNPVATESHADLPSTGNALFSRGVTYSPGARIWNRRNQVVFQVVGGGPGREIRKVVPTVPSWNQRAEWLRELDVYDAAKRRTAMREAVHHLFKPGLSRDAAPSDSRCPGHVVGSSSSQRIDTVCRARRTRRRNISRRCACRSGGRGSCGG